MELMRLSTVCAILVVASSACLAGDPVPPSREVALAQLQRMIKTQRGMMNIAP